MVGVTNKTIMKDSLTHKIAQRLMLTGRIDIDWMINQHLRAALWPVTTTHVLTRLGFCSRLSSKGYSRDKETLSTLKLEGSEGTDAFRAHFTVCSCQLDSVPVSYGVDFLA